VVESQDLGRQKRINSKMFLAGAAALDLSTMLLRNLLRRDISIAMRARMESMYQRRFLDGIRCGDGCACVVEVEALFFA
jgi:hypothetical protein